jgi:transglutaminase-like putative cysteine protease
MVQEVTVSGLASIWLPAAYRPSAVEGVDGLSFSDGSGSLITRKDTSNGLTYKVTSVVPETSPDQLRKAPPSIRGRSQLGQEFERYTRMGAAGTARVRQLASQLGERNATPYAKALAIQEHLRSEDFKYSLRVSPGHSGNAIDQFLFVTKIGYCEQFAGSFAVLARMMGLPTRVAVGFQPGAERAGTFTVKDKDAHAWPEVYFEGIGWTAFEPTPPAGNPQAEQYTGVPYTPQESPVPGEPQTTPTTAPPASSPTPGETTPPPPPKEEPTPTEDPAAAKNSVWSGIVAALRRAAPVLAVVAGLAALVLGSAAFVAWERGRRRRRGGWSAEARIHMAWEESTAALALAGVRLRPAETVAELVHRLRLPAGGAALAGVERGTPANEALVRLGDAVVQTAYAGRSAGDGMADAAEVDRSVIVGACRSSLGRWARLRGDIDPRPALYRLRTERAARRNPLPPEPQQSPG